MRLLAALLALMAATGLRAQEWNPAAAYVTPGQDEAGYRAWHAANPARTGQVSAYQAYLGDRGVGGVVPTWQLLRTASNWQRCGAEPFEVPPVALWPQIVETLRYIRAHVIPLIGPVEPVSVYRNPQLNACAGGARESAHKHLSAIDLVPLRPTTRSDLISLMCFVHGTSGAESRNGLGFYVGLRFHVDSRGFRSWGAGKIPCRGFPAQIISAAPLVLQIGNTKSAVEKGAE